MSLKTSLTLCLYLVWTVSLSAQDLTKLEHKLAKEPPCAGEKHWYCLLVFGAKAETKVWLVHDPGKDWFDPKDDVLYVDRNGNGDLTEAGEKITAWVRTEERLFSFLKKPATVHLPGFRIGTITEAGGKVQHTDLEVLSHGFCGDRPSYTVSVKINGKHTQMTTGGILRFGKTAQDAPVVHFSGPLTLHLDMRTGVAFVPNDGSPPVEEEKNLVPGKVAAITAVLGTKGLGTGTFAAFAANYPPASVNPAAEFLFPHRDPAQPLIKFKHSLGLRCCTVKFSEELLVPADAAAGKAQVNLSMPGFYGQTVTPATFTISVAQPTSSGPSIKK